VFADGLWVEFQRLAAILIVSLVVVVPFRVRVRIGRLARVGLRLTNRAHQSQTFSCVTGTMGGFGLGRFIPRVGLVVMLIAPQYLLSEWAQFRRNGDSRQI